MGISILECLKIGATGMAGLFAGCALFVNAADHPARMRMSTHDNREMWMYTLQRARTFQGAFTLFGSIAAGTVYQLDVDSEHRRLWLIGSSMLFAVWPYTILVMLPDMDRNLIEFANTTEDLWIKSHMIRWNRQAYVHTILGFTSFALFLYALTKK